MRGVIGSVFRFGIASALCEADPTQALKGRLPDLSRNTMRRCSSPSLSVVYLDRSESTKAHQREMSLDNQGHLGWGFFHLDISFAKASNALEQSVHCQILFSFCSVR